ncbi:DHA2 family efflux MFS transporter permease subunit [Acidisphaera sp. S103]|uniref:DHA2 family efflux MFS transporter permease subunit n=1 Tax=Acidisphaera sp. S103 TaxID=1747223 RepID=UPI00131AD7A6|nr:DHA2 family efflux MFS transporter permease subunit [Acidisphaera sp. S103]
MSATVASSAAADGHRTIIVAALMATYLQAVTISLPNAALLYIQGTLSMSDDEVGWIFTSYLAASMITMPMTRWLAGRYGRKSVFQISIAIFALGLVLATRATTPLQFIAARVIQGGASGPIGPLSIAILLDVVSPARHARINLVAAVTLLVGLLSGPTIGGWFSEYHDWQSIFYIALPVAGFIFLAMALSLPEKRPAQAPPFDFFGLTTFSLGIIGLQMLLDRGERMEWFDSAEIWVEASASALGFGLFFVHVLTAKTHFLDKALFKDRNFVISAMMYFAFGFVLLPTIALTSPMLDELLNYPADTTGYMAIPRSLTLVGAMILAARAPARIDNRLLLAGGMALVIYGNWRMLGYSPEMDWRAVINAGMVQGTGLGILLPTLTKTAFSTLDPTLRPEGTALFNLSRLYGSTIGIAVVLISFYDNTQAMHLALAKDLAPYRAAAHVTGSIAAPRLAMLNDMITGQAALIGIIDQFKVMMIPMLILSPLVLFLRKPKPAN